MVSVETRSAIREPRAALKEQMARLGPCFPSWQEVVLAKEISARIRAGYHQTENRSFHLVSREELSIFAFAESFELVNEEDVPEVLWAGKRALREKGPYLTKRGEMVEIYKLAPGVNGEAVDLDYDSVSRYAGNFLFVDEENIKATVERWRLTRGLIAEYRQRLHLG